ncbi:MAG: YidC/Oxa1 family membrane protein insertase [Candidatus Saccharimonadia bacterium]
MFTTILVQPLFNILLLFYGIIPGHDLGVAVIMLTLVIRLILWPLVNKQLHSQRAMQELAPDIAKIRKATKGDKQLESKQLMELYKEKEISPFAALIPLIIQLPLLFALFFALKDVLKAGEIAHLSYGPIKHLGGIKEIIAGTTVLKTKSLGFLNLAKPSIVLAVMAGAAQFVQTRQLVPKGEAAKDPNAQALALSSSIFPVITFVFALIYPAGLALYWTVTSLVAVLQQHLVLGRDVREMEESK